MYILIMCLIPSLECKKLGGERENTLDLGVQEDLPLNLICSLRQPLQL